MRPFLIIFAVLMSQPTLRLIAQDIAKHTAAFNAHLTPAEDDTAFISSVTKPVATISKPAVTNYSRKIADIRERFIVFSPLSDHQVYRITIAADVPDDKRPEKVFVKKEPGHVFIILEQLDTISGMSRSQVWGFYPIRPVSSLFFRTVQCELHDNGGRRYDASITKQLTEREFEAVKNKAIELSKKKYNLNKYNCYDYAVEVFNSIPEIEKLPLKHIKFPFVFGRGGSPCGLYRDLQQLKINSAAWGSSIKVGSFKAPASYRSDNIVQTTSHQ
jgi:hypothetical protein